MEEALYAGDGSCLVSISIIDAGVSVVADLWQCVLGGTHTAVSGGRITRQLLKPPESKGRGKGRSPTYYSRTSLQEPFSQEHPLYENHFVGNEFLAAENYLDTTTI